MSTLQMMRQVLFHPFDFFYEIQKPGRIKWHQGVIIILLAYAARMLSILLTGFDFQEREPYEISSFFEFIWLVVPWITWCVSNWGVSTILDGEGKFKEIVHGSAFALVPYVVFIVPVTLLTKILSLSEANLHSLLVLLIYCWSGWLLLLKVKILHDFDLGKTLWIVFLTLIGIGIIWFVGILLFGLINQFVHFVYDLVKELRLRA